MNTLEIDHVLKKHPSTRNVFKGVYARNRLPRRLNVPYMYISMPIREENITTPQEDHPFQVQEEGSTVCGHHRIF